jgi:hypothetical protein
MAEGSPRTLPRMRLATQIAISLGVFALASALAELFGAANLGTALAIGQLAFAATVALLIIRT